MAGKGLSLSPFAQSSPVLGHMNRVLASSGGTDRVMMFYCYFAKVLVYGLNSTALGLGTKRAVNLADRLGKLAAFTSDARVLYRLFGLLPILGWLQSMNNPAVQAAKDPLIAKIEYAQGLSMLCYYPLEHTYYLAGKGLFDLQPATIGKLARASCRFWAAYVVLQFAHIYRSKTLLGKARKALLANRVKKLKDGVAITETDKLAEKTEATRIGNLSEKLTTDLWVQLGYLPLTMHWSLESGLLPDQVWVGVFGTIAAVFGLKGVWRATA